MTHEPSKKRRPHSVQASYRRLALPNRRWPPSPRGNGRFTHYAKTRVTPTKFGRQLKRLREKAKITIYRLAHDARSDWAYVKRLETGDRRRPSRMMILHLSQALLDNSGDITLKDVDDLLKAAGYGPLPRNRVSIVEIHH